MLGLPNDGSVVRENTHTRAWALLSCLPVPQTNIVNRSFTEQWFLDRLQELAETEQRNRATFNRAVSAVVSASRCSSISSRAGATAPAVPDSDKERGLQRLATGVMTGMGTVAGGVAVTVGGVAVGVTTVTDGVAKLLQPGNKDSKQATTADE